MQRGNAPVHALPMPPHVAVLRGKEVIPIEACFWGACVCTHVIWLLILHICRVLSECAVCSHVLS